LPVGSGGSSSFIGTTNKALKSSKSLQALIAVSIVSVAVLTADL